MLNLGS
ncbi:hypothetical protein CGLO_15177 [Colletotrichum gloeosporioides Cg-14]|nr:hypothetical protein CGLO_15177 [Colletotrichum gloeosporioides Cg-14]